MNTSPLDIIVPRLSDGHTVTALFTEANTAYHSEKSIAGLNVGLNTHESKDVVLENRRVLLDHLGSDLDHAVFAHQVHGARIEEVYEPGTVSETDGLITRQQDLTLAILVADCAAVLLSDPVHGVIGAFHAGWRGAVAGIIPNGVHHMHTLGAEPATMKAFVSPCISQQHFEVGEEVAGQFPDVFVNRSAYPKPHVDLSGFVVYQLQKAGISSSHIEVNDRCTFGDSKLYSYRRQGTKSGRMAALIKLNTVEG
ncbi:MAG: peptidoglycan editing factor PgeF [Bacteroidota bacterium]